MSVIKPSARAWVLRLVPVVAAVLATGCARVDDTAQAPPRRPAILLVTLDTTRADAIGPSATGVETPSFNALASRGRLFLSAYAAVPETLPSHSTMMTGLYPAGHGVHENGRFLDANTPVLAEVLQQQGYQTAAFVSAFVLARRFGLARGFDRYDDGFEGDAVERSADATTNRALAYLSEASSTQPLFLWVHYFDAHAPYEPPEPYRTRYRDDPYRGEVAAMDAQLGRLVTAFEAHAAAAGDQAAMLVASDHGEGLGDHGEAQHGYLLYQSTVHVPLLVVAPGVTPGTVDTPVSTRRIYHTVLDLAGADQGHRASESLTAPAPDAEVVVGEAMKPFLQSGWKPQIMTVSGSSKAILSGRTELYDLATDRGETRDLTRTGAAPTAPMQTVLDEYPVPSLDAEPVQTGLDDQSRQKLASLGYVGATSTVTVRRDAPRAADMTALFPVIDEASGRFTRGDYAGAIPLLRQILTVDPENLDATLRLATAYSSTGQNGRAVEMFGVASRLAPTSPDVRLYLALHYVKGAEWRRAVPLLESVLARFPERVSALEALAVVREREGRVADAMGVRRHLYALRPPSGAELVQLGEMAMAVQQTAVAIESFEAARSTLGASFDHDLELGVVYLAARRYDEARAALDRVLADAPTHPMALFKRAQVSVLLNEPDQQQRIAAARQHADAVTRPLIEGERLFGGRR